MREIKFRAWDKYNKSMIKPCLTEWIDFEGNCYFEPAKKYNTPNTEIYPTDDYILMQFTGLHDKNGKEIYEGDIATVSEANGCLNQAVVCFVDGCFELSFITTKKRDYLKCYVVNLAVEAIGNIYENPELIPEE